MISRTKFLGVLLTIHITCITAIITMTAVQTFAGVPLTVPILLTLLIQITLSFLVMAIMLDRR